MRFTKPTKDSIALTKARKESIEIMETQRRNILLLVSLQLLFSTVLSSLQVAFLLMHRLLIYYVALTLAFALLLIILKAFQIHDIIFYKCKTLRIITNM